MKREYGIPVPRGVRKDWSPTAIQPEGAGPLLRFHGAPTEWGEPCACARWSDRFNRMRLIVGHYPNGRSATVRIDVNGNWKTLFGDVG